MSYTGSYFLCPKCQRLLAPSHETYPLWVCQHCQRAYSVQEGTSGADGPRYFAMQYNSGTDATTSW
jgi:hypothetical protein